MKFLMSLYGERSFVLMSIAELDAVGSHSPFVGEVLKIDFGFDRFFAPATPETPGRLGGDGMPRFLRGKIPQN